MKLIIYLFNPKHPNYYHFHMCSTSQSHFNGLKTMCLVATISDGAGLEHKKGSAYRKKDSKKQTNLASRTYKVLGVGSTEFL